MWMCSCFGERSADSECLGAPALATDQRDLKEGFGARVVVSLEHLQYEKPKLHWQLQIRQDTLKDQSLVEST